VVLGEPALRFTAATAAALHRPEQYVDAVMAARTVKRVALVEPREAPALARSTAGALQ